MGKSKSDKHQGRPQRSRNIMTDKADYIKNCQEQSKDFDANFSDSKIMQEFMSFRHLNMYFLYVASWEKYQKPYFDISPYNSFSAFPLYSI